MLSLSRSLALKLVACAALSAASLLCVPNAVSQNAANSEPEKPIQDNSFLIEEAYNQEDGVVQHISTFTRLSDSRQWAYSFTQEFPVRGQKSQLSYTLPILNNPELGTRGVGDLAINYRYQAIGSGETRVAFSPRVSLLLPTGDSRKGHGSGGYGFQANLPLSVVLNKHVVTHWNVGTTITPSARNIVGDTALTTGYNVGGSVIVAPHSKFNVMFETLWTGSEAVISRDRTQREHDLLLSPGIRWAHDFKNGLQIVPGIAVPIGVGPSRNEKGVFLYVSFEHPWSIFARKK
ncbi:MAG TPA: hypothetical protein VD837_16320 [Terriglobales bacterium]|nr:hypothetical protein [Terriglobales bacterium]